MINNIKAVVSLLLIVAGIAAFYLLKDQVLVLRILAVLAGVGAAVALMMTSPMGKQAFAFVQDSINEAKRVVWPSKDDTIKATLAVFVMVVAMAIFLGVADVLFAWLIKLIMGQDA